MWYFYCNVKMKNCLDLKNILTYSLKEEDKVLVLLPLGEEQQHGRAPFGEGGREERLSRG